jgi:phytoene synthase
MDVVKDAVTLDPERALALSYAAVEARAALATLFAMDDRLRHIVRVARDPTIGAIRLTWWADALERLDTAPPPAEPLLTAVARELLGRGVTGASLASTVDGWDRLLDPTSLDLAAFAEERGGRLFEAAAVVLGQTDARVATVGQGWALADLARGWPSWAVEAHRSAGERLTGAFRAPWPRPLRPLSALGLIARFDAAGDQRIGSPGRVLRLMRHRLTGH